MEIITPEHYDNSPIGDNIINSDKNIEKALHSFIEKAFHGGDGLVLTHIINKNNKHQVVWKKVGGVHHDEKEHLREVLPGDKINYKGEEHTVHAVKHDGYLQLKDKNGKRHDKSPLKVEFQKPEDVKGKEVEEDELVGHDEDGKESVESVTPKVESVEPNQVAIDRAMRDVAFNKYDYSPRILTKDVDFKWSTAPLNGGKGETGVIQLKKGQLVSVKTQSGGLGDLKVVRVYNNDGSVNEYRKMDSDAYFGSFLSIEDYQKQQSKKLEKPDPEIEKKQKLEKLFDKHRVDHGEPVTKEALDEAIQLGGDRAAERIIRAGLSQHKYESNGDPWGRVSVEGDNIKLRISDQSDSWSRPKGNDLSKIENVMKEMFGATLDSKGRGEVYEWQDDKGGKGRTTDLEMIFKLPTKE